MPSYVSPLRDLQFALPADTSSRILEYGNRYRSDQSILFDGIALDAVMLCSAAHRDHQHIGNVRVRFEPERGLDAAAVKRDDRGDNDRRNKYLMRYRVGQGGDIATEDMSAQRRRLRRRCGDYP